MVPYCNAALSFYKFLSDTNECETPTPLCVELPFHQTEPPLPFSVRKRSREGSTYHPLSSHSRLSMASRSSQNFPATGLKLVGTLFTRSIHALSAYSRVHIVLQGENFCKIEKIYPRRYTYYISFPPFC